MSEKEDSHFDTYSIESFEWGKLHVILTCSAKSSAIRTAIDIREKLVFNEPSLVDRIKNLEEEGHDASFSRSALVSLRARLEQLRQDPNEPGVFIPQ